MDTQAHLSTYGISLDGSYFAAPGSGAVTATGDKETVWSAVAAAVEAYLADR